MKVLAFIIAFLFSLPSIALSEAIKEQAPDQEEVTYVVKERTPWRFTAGWGKMYYKKWHLNLFELLWKVPDQNSMIKIGFGGSKSKFQNFTQVQGDLEADLAGILTLELPQEYELTKQVETQLWVAQIGYEYFWEVASGRWWKMDWSFYPSVGLLGQGEIVLETKKYGWHIVIDPDQFIEDSISLPTGTQKENFTFFIPACANFDFGWVSTRACGYMNVEQPKKPAAYGSISFGF